MVPPAPVLFSTTTCWPSSSPSFGAMIRAVVSVPPPGSKPTIVVMGFTGQVCASAACESASAHAAKRIFLMARSSIRDDAGALHHRRPLRHLVLHELERVLGRLL